MRRTSSRSALVPVVIVALTAGCSGGASERIDLDALSAPELVALVADLDHDLALRSRALGRLRSDALEARDAGELEERHWLILDETREVLLGHPDCAVRVVGWDIAEAFAPVLRSIPESDAATRGLLLEALRAARDDAALTAAQPDGCSHRVPVETSSCYVTLPSDTAGPPEEMTSEDCLARAAAVFLGELERWLPGRG